MTTAFAIAQLRHLYAQMLQPQGWGNAQAANAARGLLGPAIECLEQVSAPTASDAISGSTAEPISGAEFVTEIRKALPNAFDDIDTPRPAEREASDMDIAERALSKWPAETLGLLRMAVRDDLMLPAIREARHTGSRFARAWKAAAKRWYAHAEENAALGCAAIAELNRLQAENGELRQELAEVREEARRLSMPRKARQRGVDFDCEGCGKRVGSKIDNGFYRCNGCGYPGK